MCVYENMYFPFLNCVIHFVRCTRDATDINRFLVWNWIYSVPRTYYYCARTLQHARLSLAAHAYFHISRERYPSACLRALLFEDNRSIFGNTPLRKCEVVCPVRTVIQRRRIRVVYHVPNVSRRNRHTRRSERTESVVSPRYYACYTIRNILLFRTRAFRIR